MIRYAALGLLILLSTAANSQPVLIQNIRIFNGVDAKLTDVYDVVGRAGIASRTLEDRSNPGSQFPRREGLDNVIVSAKFQPEDAVDLIPSGGEQDHGDVCLPPQR